MAHMVLPASEQELPGAGYDFQDVTNLFDQAGFEMESGELLFMDNFTLQEAMCALEIGEPRLDTGLIVQEQQRPPFKPITPMLPEEVCWIFDRAAGLESEFHKGNFLAHTVHTLLYVHHLSEIDPDTLGIPLSFRKDPLRPIELITVVLRTYVRALLKCCDLSWRELSKGGVYDTEDWQSDKCEVSLLEGIPAISILQELDNTIDWLFDSSIPTQWKFALRARLLFRKTFLHVLASDPIQHRHDFQRLVFLGKDYLHAIQSTPSPSSMDKFSPAYLAFDPSAGRKLSMAIPIRVLPPPTFEDTWMFWSRFFDGLYEIGLLETTESLCTWETVGFLRGWRRDPPLEVSYIRSLTQSTFYDGVLILNRFPLDWAVNHFFSETVGVSWDVIKTAVSIRFSATEGHTEPGMGFRKVERCIYKLLTPHIRSLFYNPPRRRRHFMKSVLEWHALYDALTSIQDDIDMEGLPRGHFLDILPSVPLLWRLGIMREIVLSGFQLELYADEEKSFAYWYTAKVIEQHLVCLDRFLRVVDDESNDRSEMIFQVHFLTALQALCEALFVVSMPLMPFNWQSTKPNFYRRYKWAFRPEYDAYETPPVVQPALASFVRRCGEILQNGSPTPAPAESVQLAKSILEDLIASGDSRTGGRAGLWGQDRVKLIENIITVCDNLSSLPNTPEEMDGFDPKKSLKWDPEFHPWFPSYKLLSTLTSS